MSDAHDEHESLIKTPKQLIVAVVAAFLVPIFIIALLVNYVGNTPTQSSGSTDEERAEAVAKRIHPVATLSLKDPSAPRVFKTGEQVYTELCVACHATGAAGAPKFGAAGDWSARLGQGLDGLLKSLLNGKGAMAARAGSSPDDYSDYELARAVVHLANSAGGKLTEPAAPAQAAPQAAAEGSAAPAPAAPAAAPAAAAPAPAAAAAPAADLGKKVYEQTCAACHAAGVAGAPKFGDKAAWAPRLAQGADALHASVLKGKGIMPPKGGYAGPDSDVVAASDYMIQAAK